MQRRQKEELRMEKIKMQEAKINAERTAFRKRETELKNQEKETLRMIAEQKAVKLQNRLEELKAQNPYHEAVVNMTTDTERLNKQTEAFKRAVEQEKIDATLFKKHGYSDQEIFKDIRFQIGAALRAAGLNGAYAQQMMSKLQAPSRPSAMRN